MAADLVEHQLLVARQEVERLDAAPATRAGTACEKSSRLSPPMRSSTRQLTLWAAARAPSYVVRSFHGFSFHHGSLKSNGVPTPSGGAVEVMKLVKVTRSRGRVEPAASVTEISGMEGWGSLPRNSRLGYGRRMPSAFMREVSVEGFMPRRSAAPASPETFQAVASSARSDVPPLERLELGDGLDGSGLRRRGLAGDAPAARGRGSGCSSRAVIAARSITFWSSRTLPGHS